VVAGFVFLMAGPIGGALVWAALILIPLNIPTLIFLLIYFLSRKKMNADNNQEMKKMTIHDLE
jgi:Mn2+/Fe2+ NRAMP family transporter